MDQKTLNEAVENISMIKEVIQRTGKTLAGFSRVFIYWGCLFIAFSVFSLYMIADRESTVALINKWPAVGYLLPTGITGILAAVIYLTVSKKTPLVGFEKYLAILWMLILIMNTIPSKTTIDTSGAAVDLTKVLITTDRSSILLFSLAIALIVTSLFAGYRQFMYLGCIYIGASLIYAYTRVPFLDTTKAQIMLSAILPFTFLYIGFFLKVRQTRRD